MSASRVYVFVLLCGKEKKFTSVSAFDGYVAERKRLGAVLTWAGPFRVVLEASA